MTFNINVKVDPSQATVAAKTIGAELGKAEAKGVQAGNAIAASLDKAAAKGQKLAASAKEADKAVKSLADSGNVFDKIGGMWAAAAGGLYAGKKVIELADAHTALSNRLGQVADAARRNNKETMTTTQLYNRLYDVSQDTRQSIEGTTTAFIGLSRATDKLGMSQEQTIGLTETINKLVAGADAESAAAGLRQFGQAMASGVLQGDELRSIMENLPQLAQAIADGIGVTTAELRKMGSEGKLNTTTVIKGLEKMGAAADEAFGKSRATIGDRFTQIKNFATTYAGDLAGPFSDNAQQRMMDQIQAERDRGIKATRDQAAALAQARDQISYMANPTQYLIDLQHKLADANNRITTSLHENSNAYLDAAKMINDHKAAAVNARREIDALMNAREQVEAAELRGTKSPDVPSSLSYDSLIESKQRDERRMRHGELGPVLDIRDSAEAAGNELRRMNGLYREGKITTAEYAKVTKDLKSQMDAAYGRDSGVDYYKRILDDILQPQRDFTGSVAALDAIMASGRITMQQYNDEFRKLSESYDKSGFAKLFNDATTTKMQTPRPHGAQVQDAEFALYNEGLQRGGPDEMDLERDLAVFDKQEQAAADYKTFMADVEATTLRWRLETMTSTSMVGDAWDAMAAQATDVAGAMESVFTSAYRGIEDALTSLITKQKLDMQSFVDMMLEQMARLAIRSAISGIAGAIGGGGGNPATELGDVGALIFDPTWGGGSSARTAQPTSPTIGPADSGGVSARRSGGGGTTIIVQQSPDALLPALERPGGVRSIARIAVREAGPALSRRPRYG